MKTLGWMLSLSLLAVLLAAVLRYSPGYVLIVIPPWRLELSVGLALVALAALFLIGHLLLRAGSRLAGLPGEVREWRVRGQRVRGTAALVAAMRAYLAGHHGRALAHARQACAEGAAPAVAALIAARAAQELRRLDERDQFTAQASLHDADDPTARLMAQGQWLADEGRAEEALAVLRTLPAQHTAALRLELRLQQHLAKWERVRELIDRLAERGVLPPLEREQMERQAASEGLKHRALDARSALDAWQRLPATVRTDPVVALTAARLLASHGDAASARPIIEQALDEKWDSALALQYSEHAADMLPADVAAGIVRCEGWLTGHSGDAMLLLSLGRLCARDAIWGKAQSYLEASLSLEPSYSAHLALASLHESLNHPEAAASHRGQALALTLRALDTTTGGRRRVVL